MLLGVGEPFKGKFKGKPSQGLVAWTLSASPDDQPAGRLGQECPGDERGKENRAGKPAALGNNPGGSNGLRGQVCTKGGQQGSGDIL